jgi:hypothetical protein
VGFLSRLPTITIVEAAPPPAPSGREDQLKRQPTRREGSQRATVTCCSLERHRHRHLVPNSMRATRRMDEMRREQKETVGVSAGTRGSRIKGARVDEKPTLAEAGIGKNLAHEGHKLGALSEKEFARAVTTAREAVGRVVEAQLAPMTKRAGAPSASANSARSSKRSPTCATG